MSIKAMSEVWEHSKQKGNGLLLMLAIADFANDDLKCYPSVDRLAFKTRMSRRNIQTLCRQLVEEGEIQIHENKGPSGCNVYEIMGVQTLHPCKPAPEKGTEGGANQRPALAPKPSGTVTKEPSGINGASAPTDEKAAKEAERKKRHTEFVDKWHKSYQANFGRKYIFHGKDWKPLAALLLATDMSAEQLADLAWRAWKCRGREYFHCGKAVTVGYFATHINEIMSELKVEHDTPRDSVEDNHEAKHGVPRGTIALSQRPFPGQDEHGNEIGRAEWEKRFPLNLYDHDK